MTERDDERPAEEEQVPDGADAAEREARLEAMLSLGSEPPPSLDALVASRRTRGDRVILPVPEVVARGGHGWRRFAMPAALVAAAAVVFALAQVFSASRQQEVPSPPLAIDDTTVREPATIPRAPVPDTPGAEPAPALAPGRPSREDVALGLGTPRAGERRVHATRLAEWSAAAVDSVASLAAAHPRARVTITYPAGDGALELLAARVQRELVERGVPPLRIATGPQPEGRLAPIAVLIGVLEPQ